MTRRDLLCKKGRLAATIELKMSLRWSLPELRAALESQLLSTYLQDQFEKIGFFVIVLQKQKTWTGPEGTQIDFDEMLAILNEDARIIVANGEADFVRVIGIDATSPDTVKKGHRP
jgi:hypothetical protein